MRAPISNYVLAVSPTVTDLRASLPGCSETDNKLLYTILRYCVEYNNSLYCVEYNNSLVEPDLAKFYADLKKTLSDQFKVLNWHTNRELVDTMIRCLVIQSYSYQLGDDRIICVVVDSFEQYPELALHPTSYQTKFNLTH